MDRKRSAIPYHEVSTLSLLTIKVVKAAHIPWADLMSNSDCYVCLWLPTCTNKVQKTKTMTNTSDPEWNETFYFAICNHVKNVLHLSLHDEDVITGNDLLYTLTYDLGKVLNGETKQKTFSLNPNGPEFLQVEFTRQEYPDFREKIVTNGVIVAREMTCLDISVEKQRIPENLLGKQLVFSLEDSCEDVCRMELSPCTDANHIQTCRFHYLTKWDPKFTAHVEGANNQSIQIIPVKTLRNGYEQKVLLSTVPDLARFLPSLIFMAQVGVSWSTEPACWPTMAS